MKNQIIGVAVLGILVLCALLLYIFVIRKNNSLLAYKDKTSSIDGLIKDVYTDKAAYHPGDTVRLSVGLENRTNDDISGVICVDLKSCDKTVKSWMIRGVKLSVNEKSDRILEMDMPSDDFQGYLVEIRYKNGSGCIDYETTAIDVSSDWTKFPRYGYIASFNEQSTEAAAAVINNLSRYHLNGLMFYDWQFRHDAPLAENAGEKGSRWHDIANRSICGDTVRDYITQAHSCNMACMNYNLIFGALDNYQAYGVKDDWGIFKDSGHQDQEALTMPSGWATDKIFLMDPANADWQRHIIKKEKEVFEVFDFDGWHIDQLGERRGLHDYSGKPVDLAQGYLSLINAAGAELGGKKLAFNAVGMYGQEAVAQSPYLPFLYAEIWNTSSFQELKSAIDDGFSYTGNAKTTVLAAYINYKKTGGEFNEAAVRLADAVIFADGGAHIELGDHGMLSHEYFPNDKLGMSDSLIKAMRRYYDFIVAYENLLRDHCVPIDRKLTVENLKTSPVSKPGAIWYFTKSKGPYEVLHLINLTSTPSDDWRDDYGWRKPPELKKNLSLKYYTSEKIGKVMAASPDYDKSIMTSLDFTSGSDSEGSYIEINVPSLEYWDMIIFEKSVCASA